LTPQRRLLILIGAVSALLPLSGVLLANGIGEGQLSPILFGSVFGAAALFGLVALGRMIVVLERGRIGR
jgi:hypothetical protein